MAGSYPDAPSRRMAYDVDGTVCLWDFWSSNDFPAAGADPTYAVAEMTAGERTNINDEDPTTGIGSISGGSYRSLYWMMIFPELRDIDGILMQTINGASTTWAWSSGDTTNGIDGTFSQTVPVGSNTNSVLTTAYRDFITSAAVATEKGIRGAVERSSTNTDTHLKSLHIYGAISAAETPDRMLFLDTSAADAVFTKLLDFDEVPRGQTATGNFKIKNNSSTFQIDTVSITAEDLYLNAGGWYTFGDDEITYAATFAVGNMGTGASQLIYYKQIIPDAETLGVQAGRIKVSHASLT